MVINLKRHVEGKPKVLANKFVSLYAKKSKGNDNIKVSAVYIKGLNTRYFNDTIKKWRQHVLETSGNGIPKVVD